MATYKNTLSQNVRSNMPPMALMLYQMLGAPFAPNQVIARSELEVHREIYTE